MESGNYEIHNAERMEAPELGWFGHGYAKAEDRTQQGGVSQLGKHS